VTLLIFVRLPFVSTVSFDDATDREPDVRPLADVMDEP